MRKRLLASSSSSSSTASAADLNMFDSFSLASRAWSLEQSLEAGVSNAVDAVSEEVRRVRKNGATSEV